MKLKDYLKLIGKKPVTWAKEVGMSPATVWRLVKGKTKPDYETIKAITRVTNGAVKPEDWF